MNPANQCEQAAGLLPELWSNELETPERASDKLWLHQHLAACGDCTAMAELWQRLGDLPAAAPDARQRVRFEQMLAAYGLGMEATAAPAPARPAGGWRLWYWHPAPALAAAVLVCAGLVGGWLLRGARPPAAATGQQMAELREEVQSTRQIAVLSLLRQQSPSDRLQGVSYSTGLVSTDPSILDALLHSLKYDSSPDVRLAAMDTLTRHAALPQIQQDLVDAFAYQQSPLVQVALVDSFVETGNPKAHALLQKISQDKTYSLEVRTRAAWGLAQPEWN
ncbi:MAG: HEAT repeat domain-containing protein [Terriglobales bacterium]